MAHFHIIYSSLGGNTELVVKVVQHVLKERGHEITLERCEKSNLEKIKESDCFILAAPTYGHGEPDERFAKFLKDNADFNFENHPYTLIGLGDSKYDDDYNMAILPRMMNFLAKGKGKRIHFPMGIDKSPLPHIAGRIIPWAEDLAKLFE